MPKNSRRIVCICMERHCFPFQKHLISLSLLMFFPKNIGSMSKEKELVYLTPSSRFSWSACKNAFYNWQTEKKLYIIIFFDMWELCNFQISRFYETQLYYSFTCCSFLLLLFSLSLTEKLSHSDLGRSFQKIIDSKIILFSLVCCIKLTLQIFIPHL